jgi:hypothetical protein
MVEIYFYHFSEDKMLPDFHISYSYLKQILPMSSLLVIFRYIPDRLLAESQHFSSHSPTWTLLSTVSCPFPRTCPYLLMSLFSMSWGMHS